MAKLPDFGGLTKKLDIHGLMDTVKSAVSGVTAPAKAPEGDEVAARFVEAINQMQSLAAAHSEQAKTISSLQSQLNALYKDVQVLRSASTTNTSSESATTAEKPTDTPTDSTDSNKS